MPEIVWRPARPEDAAALAPLLRVEDAAEVFAMGYETTEAALAASVASSSEAFAVELDGELSALFGVVTESVLGGVGNPWLLGSPALSRVPRAMVAVPRAVLRRWLRTYRVLHTFVDARYGRAIRWARVVGFDVSEPCVPGGLTLPHVYIVATNHHESLRERVAAVVPLDHEPARSLVPVGVAAVGVASHGVDEGSAVWEPVAQWVPEVPPFIDWPGQADHGRAFHGRSLHEAGA